MKVDAFVDLFSGYFVGVPDSQLSSLCDVLMARYGLSANHVIAANEGNAAAIAAGWYLSTGKIPVVYLQNSGIGNTVNPVASLLNNKVYGIPCVFIIGWRGEPGGKDEPQHSFQGEITTELLDVMGIKSFVIEKETNIAEIAAQMKLWKPHLEHGGSVAFIVKKGAFEPKVKPVYHNDFAILREKAVETIAAVAGEAIIVSTTGKISRELYEARERRAQSHKYDFISVGAMGHCSSVAMAIAEQKPHTKVWCIDGDGAALMHMGAMAVIGSRKPRNMVHIVLNNAAHESVGGLPTVAADISFVKIALGCGYPRAFAASDYEAMEYALDKAKESDSLTFLEITCKLHSRENLTRPSMSPQQNKADFMNYILELE